MFKLLFSLGARPSFKRIIFLITDGNQFPAIDDYGNKLDPVASSQQLYDDGVQIFVVGIGTALNKEELKKIARDPSRVYSASNFNDLLSEEFVKNVSKKLCQGGQLGRLFLNIFTVYLWHAFKKQNINDISQHKNLLDI